MMKFDQVWAVSLVWLIFYTKMVVRKLSYTVNLNIHKNFGLRSPLRIFIIMICSQVIQNFHKLINPPISTQSRLVSFMFHQIAIYYHHHHHHNYQQQQQPLLLLKVRNLSLVYPAVTLCYKNEDQQGYKLNVLKVVKTNNQTSFVVISLSGIQPHWLLEEWCRCKIKLKFRISQRQAVL